MNLYAQTAPLLEEDPTQQPTPQPPHKFWRGMWEFRGTPQGLEVINLLWDLMDVGSVPTQRLKADGSLILNGPIYPTAELCEQEQLAIQQNRHSWQLAIVWFFIKPVKTDEFGASL